MGNRFDDLIRTGRDTDAMRYLAQEYYDNGKMGHTRKLLLERVADRCDQLTAQPDNEPLTLKQLRGMDGEPVKIDDDGAIFYGIVSLSGNCFTKEEAITLADGNFYLFRDMDVKVHPILQRRKPEPEGGRG